MNRRYLTARSCGMAVHCSKGAQPWSVHARDNIAQFIRWTQRFGASRTIKVEVEDFMKGGNEKRVLYW